MTSAPPAAPVAAPSRVQRRQRQRIWPWWLVLLAMTFVVTAGWGFWQRRPMGRSLAIKAPAVRQGAVSVTLTYVASLERYPTLPDVPRPVQSLYLRAPVFFRRLFDAASDFVFPHFRTPPPGTRFFEVVCSGQAPPHAQPGFGPGADPELAAGGAPTRLDQVAWGEPGLDGVYRLRLVFIVPLDSRAATLNVTIGGERFVLTVPEP